MTAFTKEQENYIEHEVQSSLRSHRFQRYVDKWELELKEDE